MREIPGMRAIACQLRWVSTRPTRRRLVVIGGPLVLALVAGLAAWRAPVGQLWDSLASAQLDALAVALPCFCMASLLAALALYRLLVAGGAGVGLGRTLAAAVVRQICAAGVPGAVADGARLLVLRGGGAPLARCAGGFGASRIIESSTTFAVVAASAPLLPLPDQVAPLAWAPLGAFALTIVAVLVGRRASGRLRAALPARIGGIVDGLVRGAAGLGRPQEVGRLYAIQAAVVALRLCGVWALLVAFGIAASPATVLLVYVMVSAAAVVPSPGGAGAREAAVVPALVAASSASVSDALAFSLALQGMGLCTGLSLGLLLSAAAAPRRAWRAVRPATA